MVDLSNEKVDAGGNMGRTLGESSNTTDGTPTDKGLRGTRRHHDYKTV
jgi:hypothetical protein